MEQEQTPSVDGAETQTKTYPESFVNKLLEEKAALKGRLANLTNSDVVAKELEERLKTTLMEKQALFEELNSTKSAKDAIESAIKERDLETVISTALDAAGCKSSISVSKLVDKSKIGYKEDGSVDTETVVSIIKEIQKSDPFFFGKELDPKESSGTLTDHLKNSFGIDAKRAGEGTQQSSFDIEVANAKSQKELLDVAKKYGKI